MSLLMLEPHRLRRDGTSRMKILFLQKRILFPPDVGMRIRTLNVLRDLCRRHDVTYLCNVLPNDQPHLERMRHLGGRLVTIPWNEPRRGSVRFFLDLLRNLASRFPYNVDKDFDPRLRRRAARLLTEEAFDLLICDFVQAARNVIGLPAPASLLFQHNVEAEIFRRQTTTGSPWRRAYFRLQYRRMRRFEAAAGATFDRVVAVSVRDRRTFERDYSWRHVREIDTAVDLDVFRPADAPVRTGRCIFVGSLDWLPNQQGARWFAERVWPMIRAEKPQAEFQIIGRNPSTDVLRLGRIPGIDVVGPVADVRPYLAEAEVVVVPLLSGGGTRLKIYEAMAMRRPVVSTSLGAEGLPIVHGEHLLVADSPDDFARSIRRLFDDPPLRNRLADSAYRLVTENFSADAVSRQFEHICREAIAVARHRRAETDGR